MLNNFLITLNITFLRVYESLKSVDRKLLVYDHGAFQLCSFRHKIETTYAMLKQGLVY